MEIVIVIWVLLIIPAIGLGWWLRGKDDEGRP